MKAIMHWRPYLIWTEEPFTIYTDHANLLYWKSPRKLNRRTARWHSELQDYDFVLEHVPGKTLTNSALSFLQTTPSNDDSCKYGMMDLQPAIQAETKQSDGSTVNTTGLACAPGYRTTSRDVPSVNKTKT